MKSGEVRHALLQAFLAETTEDAINTDIALLMPAHQPFSLFCFNVGRRDACPALKQNRPYVTFLFDNCYANTMMA